MVSSVSPIKKTQKKTSESAGSQTSGVFYDMFGIQLANSIPKPADGVLFKCFLCQQRVSPLQLFREHLKKHNDYLCEIEFFVCFVCGDTFDDEKSVKEHEKTHDRNETPKCRECGEPYDHLTRKHTGPKPFKCVLCLKEFKKGSDYHAHLFSHSGEERYKCSICNMGFHKATTYRAHKLLHGIKPSKCHVCTAEFNDNISLSSHLERHSLAVKKCEVCDKEFKSLLSLEKHIVYYQDSKIFTCKMCKMKFHGLPHFQKHVVSHLSSTSFHDVGKVCNSSTDQCIDHNTVKTLQESVKDMYCNETNTSTSLSNGYVCEQGLPTEQGYFERHISKCIGCNVGFVSKAHLSIHIVKRHKIGERYKCSVCQEMFFEIMDYHKHQKKHLGKYLHRCDICFQKFNHKNNFFDHKQNHVNKERFNCNWCGMRYNDSESLREHKDKNDCWNGKAFTCVFCGTDFERLFQLQLHTKSHMTECFPEHKKCSKEVNVNHADITANLDVSETNITHEDENGINDSVEVENRTETSSCKSEVLSQENSLYGIGVTFDSTGIDDCDHSNTRLMFSCGVCNNEFPTLPELQQHLKLHEDRNIPPGKTGLSSEHDIHKDLGSSHSQLERYTTGMYQCGLCLQSFANISVLNTHILEHMDDMQTHKCDMRCSVYDTESFHHDHCINNHGPHKNKDSGDDRCITSSATNSSKDDSGHERCITSSATNSCKEESKSSYSINTSRTVPVFSGHLHSSVNVSKPNRLERLGIFELLNSSDIIQQLPPKDIVYKCDSFNKSNSLLECQSDKTRPCIEKEYSLHDCPVHLLQKLYRCRKCKLSFNLTSDLVNHCASHDDEQTDEASHDGEKTGESDSLTDEHTEGIDSLTDEQIGESDSLTDEQTGGIESLTDEQTGESDGLTDEQTGGIESLTDEQTGESDSLTKNVWLRNIESERSEPSSKESYSCCSCGKTYSNVNELHIHCKTHITPATVKIRKLDMTTHITKKKRLTKKPDNIELDTMPQNETEDVDTNFELPGLPSRNPIILANTDIDLKDLAVAERLHSEKKVDMEVSTQPASRSQHGAVMNKADSKKKAERKDICNAHDRKVLLAGNVNPKRIENASNSVGTDKQKPGWKAKYLYPVYMKNSANIKKEALKIKLNTNAKLKHSGLGISSDPLQNKEQMVLHKRRTVFENVTTGNSSCRGQIKVLKVSPQSSAKSSTDENVDILNHRRKCVTKVSTITNAKQTDSLIEDTLNLTEKDTAKSKVSENSQQFQYLLANATVNVFQCKVCDRIFRTSNGLSAHHSFAHPELPRESQLASVAKNMYMCSICDRYFKEAHGLKVHVGICHSRKTPPFQCYVCEMEFPTDQLLQAHVFTHLRKETSSLEADNSASYDSSCIINNAAGTQNLEDLVSDTSHNSEKVVEKNTSCDDNPEKRSNSVTTSCKARPYLCRVCDRAFSTIHGIQIHVNHHTGEEPTDHLPSKYLYQCLHCDKDYLTITELKSHCFKHDIQQPISGQDEQTPNTKTKGKLVSSENFLNTVKNKCMLRRGETLSTGNPYQCVKCSKAYPTVYSLYSHSFVHRDTTLQFPFKCLTCKEYFRSINAILDHVRFSRSAKSREKNKDLFSCNKCSRFFFTKQGLRHHLNYHISQERSYKYQCVTCNQKFSNADALQVHSKSHKDNPSQGLIASSNSLRNRKAHIGVKLLPRCDICLQEFPSTEQLKKHRTGHTEEKEADENRIRVKGRFEEITNSIGKTNKARKRNSLSEKNTGEESSQHHSRGKRPCKESTGAPASCIINDDATHSAKKDGRENYRCDICNKHFKSINEMKDHRMSHPRNNSKTVHGQLRVNFNIFRKKYSPFYKCNICDREYSSVTGLQTHYKIHTQAGKRYICQVCDATFDKPLLLRDHLLNHEDTLLKCPVCGQSYMNLKTFNAHKRTHFKKQTEITCTRCFKKFSTSTDLALHRSSCKHKRPFECVICGRGFRSKKTLKNHTRIHKETQYYKCSYCSKRYTMEFNLRRHAFSVHGKTSVTNKQNIDVHSRKCLKNTKSMSNARVRIPNQDPKNQNEKTQNQNHLTSTNAANKHVTTDALQSNSKEPCLDIEKSKCLICGLTFENEQHRGKHMWVLHKKCIYNCKKCDTKFSRQAALDKHILQKHKKLQHKLLSVPTLHLDTLKDRKDQHICIKCNLHFPSMNAKQRHIADKHDNILSANSLILTGAGFNRSQRDMAPSKFTEQNIAKKKFVQLCSINRNSE